MFKTFISLASQIIEEEVFLQNLGKCTLPITGLSFCIKKHPLAQGLFKIIEI